jgi:AraC-like DNA-binding protein
LFAGFSPRSRETGRLPLLNHAFNAVTLTVVGETPGAYLTSWRLALGRRELRAGRSVKAVAARVGFGSAAAFSRAFSRKYGHPPGIIGKAFPASPRISALESEP